uniref:Uncharacterized protein n=1 Tax=Trichuris muris TaxID=70415 RepID=A0A5S6QD60_TRIMR
MQLTVQNFILCTLVSYSFVQEAWTSTESNCSDEIPEHVKRTSVFLESFNLPTAEVLDGVPANEDKRISFFPGQIQRNLQGSEKERLVRDVEREMNRLLEGTMYYSTEEVIYAAKCAPGPEGPILVEISMRKTNCKVETVTELGTDDQCIFSEPPTYISCVWQGTARNGSKRDTMGVICYKDKANAGKNHRERIEDEVCLLYKYPQSEMLRLVIPYKYKAWKQNVLIYKPQKYDTVYKSGSAFEDKLKSIEKRNSLKRTESKRSAKNPYGRTGLSGKGALPQLGLNHLIIPVLMRENYGVPEVLVEVDSFDQYGRVQLPRSFELDPETNILGAELTQAFEQLFTTSVSHAMARHVFSQARKIAKKRNHQIYEGYIPDPRTTDDAWVDATVTVYMDKHRTRFGFFDLTEHESLLRYGWRSLKNATDAKNKHVFLQTLLPPSVNDAILGNTQISKDTSYAIKKSLKSTMLSINDIVFTGLGLFFDLYVSAFALLAIVSELFVYLGKQILNGGKPK